MGKVLVRLEGVSYSYDGVKALEDISLTIHCGEVVSILGPNGAGKTTLLKCLLKILKPHGAIYIDGREINTYRVKELARIIGYVPQIHHSVFAYRVLDFVLMGRAPYHSMFSLPSESEYDKAMEILEELGIRNLADRTVAEVSGGQLQLVLIARALIQEAKILLLDEPTAHLDVSNELRVLSIVYRLVHSRVVDTAIMAMHNPLTASMFSDRIVLMKNNRVVAEGSPREVLTRENLYKAYGVDFEIIVKDGRVIAIPCRTNTIYPIE